MQRIDISLLQKNRSIFLKTGLIVALGLAILAFNWTIYDHPADYQVASNELQLDDIEMIRTRQEQKRALPPPSIKPSEVVQEEVPEFIEELPQPEPIITSLPLTEPSTDPVTFTPPEPMPLPPAPKRPKVADDLPFIIVEEMPSFSNCAETAANKQERQRCSDQAVLKYMYTNIKYPAIARENGIEGTVFVQFTIGKEGQIEDAEVVRGGEGGLGKEALRVIKEMPTWVPGKQRGRTVRVRMTLPIRFKLN
ncbi:MAG: TonB family protein [Bacteroidota bacterium]